MKSNWVLQLGLSISVVFLFGCDSKSTKNLQSSDVFEETSFTHKELLMSNDNGAAVRLSRPAIKASSGRGFVAEATGWQPGYEPSSGGNYAPGYFPPRAPQYGYGKQMDAFIGFAEYSHSRDPRLISIIRITFGDLGKYATVQTAQTQNNLIATVYSAAWNLSLKSDHDIQVLRALPNTLEYNVQNWDGKTINAKYNLPLTAYDGNQYGKMAFIIGVRAGGFGQVANPAVCADPYQLQLQGQQGANSPFGGMGSYDPFAMSIQGHPSQFGNWNSNNVYGSQYFYYPPRPCAPPQEQTALNLSGEINGGLYATGPTVNPAAIAPVKVNEILDDIVNDRSGYAPFREIDLMNGNTLQFRAVNYNGKDWAQPEPYPYPIPQAQ